MADDALTPDLLPVDVDESLAAMLRAYPLPQGVEDADMNQQELAQALSTTVNTVGKWIGAGMPVVEAGGMGKQYVLRLSHCYAWRRARKAEEDQRDRHNRAQINALQAEFLGFDTNDPAAQLTAKQRAELAEADIKHSRAKQLRRQLVPLGDVVELIEGLFVTIRNAIEGMPDRLERELSLSPEEVVAVQRIGDDILGAMSEQIEEAHLREEDIEEVEVQRQWMV